MSSLVLAALVLVIFGYAAFVVIRNFLRSNPALIPLPLWPLAGDAFFVRAKETYDAFRSFGLPVNGSLGMLAQAEAESACEPEARGDHVNGEPTAFGMFQWHGPRVAAIKIGCGVDIMTFPPIADQCRAAWCELLTFTELGLSQLLAATTPDEAGRAGCLFFERAGADDAAERRGAMATRWAQYAAQNEWLN